MKKTNRITILALVCLLCLAGADKEDILRNECVDIRPDAAVMNHFPFDGWGFDLSDAAWKDWRDEMSKPCTTANERAVVDQKTRKLIEHITIGKILHKHLNARLVEVDDDPERQVRK